MVFRLFAFLLLQCLALSAAHAAAIGMPESTARIGYGLGFAKFSIDDPNGSTKDDSIVQPFTLIYTDWLPKGLRYWGEAYYEEASLDSSTKDIGQDVEHYGLRLSVQKDMRIASWIAPWFGVGVDVSQGRYTGRRTIDIDGFVATRYKSRSKLQGGAVFNMTAEWKVASDWSVGAKVEHLVSFGDSIGTTSVSGVVLYRF